MSQPFYGEIKMFGGNFAIRGYAFCRGQLMAISQNDALFTLLGTTYGGDGATTFGLPDLRGRAPIGQGLGPGLTNRAPGESGGSEAVTLTGINVPVHSHTVFGNTGAGTASVPTGNFWAANANVSSAQYSFAPDTSMNGASVAATGGQQPHENMMPYLGINFIIALDGIYPTPN